MDRRHAVITLVATLSLVAPDHRTQAQYLPDDESDRSYTLVGTLGFAVGIPTGEFGDYVGEEGFGLDGSVAWAPTKLPLLIGLNLGYLSYGAANHRRVVNTVPVDVRISNHIVLGHVVARVQPKLWILRPYVDGLIGFKYFGTSTSLNAAGTGNEITSKSNVQDVAFSYGVGAGVDVRLVGQVYLDVGVRYLLGTEARYLKDGVNDPASALESRTNMTCIHAGVTFISD
jgi:hypothetical protein